MSDLRYPSYFSLHPHETRDYSNERFVLCSAIRVRAHRHRFSPSVQALIRELNTRVLFALPESREDIVIPLVWIALDSNLYRQIRDSIECRERADRRFAIHTQLFGVIECELRDIVRIPADLSIIFGQELERSRILNPSVSETVRNTLKSIQSSRFFNDALNINRMYEPRYVRATDMPLSSDSFYGTKMDKEELMKKDDEDKLNPNLFKVNLIKLNQDE